MKAMIKYAAINGLLAIGVAFACGFAGGLFDVRPTYQEVVLVVATCLIYDLLKRPI